MSEDAQRKFERRLMVADYGGRAAVAAIWSASLWMIAGLMLA